MEVICVPRNFKKIERNGYVFVHTYGCDSDSDVSFQDGIIEKRLNNLENAYLFCDDAGIDARGNLAVVGFNPLNNDHRIIKMQDDSIMNKKDGNILITSTNVALMAYANDDCLIAFTVEHSKYVGVMRVSPETLNRGAIDSAIQSIMMAAGADCYIEAFVGHCESCSFNIALHEFLYDSGVDDIEDFFGDDFHQKFFSGRSGDNGHYGLFVQKKEGR